MVPNPTMSTRPRNDEEAAGVVAFERFMVNGNGADSGKYKPRDCAASARRRRPCSMKPGSRVVSCAPRRRLARFVEGKLREER